MISNSYVEYKEKNNITRQTGTVRFHHLNGVFSNVTNNKKAAGQEMSAVINAKLLDQAAFTTRWKFYLFHPQGRFDLSGSVNAMNAALFNPLIEASGPGAIREGKLDGLDFSLQGDDGKMRGNVKLLYSDLKIDLLNNKKSGDKKTMGSFLANMIIKNSNPNKNEKIREMNVSMTRDVNRSLFWLCWKTIFKGIKETVGIKENTERVKKRNGELRGTNKR